MDRAAGLAADDALVTRLAELSEGYSGAEIEQTVVVALFDAFAERRALMPEDLFRALATMVPLSVTQAEQITAIREWADIRAVAATAPEDRTGYAATGAEHRSGPPPRSTRGDRGPEPVAASRGGRTVDF